MRISNAISTMCPNSILTTSCATNQIWRVKIKVTELRHRQQIGTKFYANQAKKTWCSTIKTSCSRRPSKRAESPEMLPIISLIYAPRVQPSWSEVTIVGCSNELWNIAWTSRISTRKTVTLISRMITKIVTLTRAAREQRLRSSLVTQLTCRGSLLQRQGKPTTGIATPFHQAQTKTTTSRNVKNSSWKNKSSRATSASGRGRSSICRRGYKKAIKRTMVLLAAPVEAIKNWGGRILSIIHLLSPRASFKSSTFSRPKTKNSWYMTRFLLNRTRARSLTPRMVSTSGRHRRTWLDRQGKTFKV